MLLSRNNASTTFLRSARRGAISLPQRRHISTIRADILQAHTEVAEKLAATRLWHYGKNKQRAKVPKGDKTRVNIVDEKLCDDVIEYMRPSLQRHVGCDLIDIYPGAGLWSRKLHDALQPRTHILMEPDVGVYEPFLEPLLARGNTTLIPKSGIVWGELNSVLNPAVLPHQVERRYASHETPQRNDTLLVVANLAAYPKKKFRNFPSVAQLVLFQFISAIRTSALFQKYGLVRMLIWAGDDEKGSILPRSVQRRKRMAVEAELSTEWLTEVAGADGYEMGGAKKRAWFHRDLGIDLESGRAVLDRMRAAGTAVPAGRETQLMQQLLAREGDVMAAAGSTRPSFDRPFLVELQELEAAFSAKGGSFTSAQYERLKALRYKHTQDLKRGDEILELLVQRDAIADAKEALGRAGGTDAEEELVQREQQWDDSVRGLTKSLRGEFVLARDNLHVFRQKTPVMAWDRRDLEPLRVRHGEFFPNVPLCLLDIQPRATHQLLRETGPRSSRAGDVFELILRELLHHSVDPISRALESVYPGAGEGIAPHCPSLRDRSAGGMPLAGWGEISPRSLNEAQLLEMLQAWARWPFAPSFSELVARITDDFGDGVDEDGNSSVTPTDFL